MIVTLFFFEKVDFLVGRRTVHIEGIILFMEVQMLSQLRLSHNSFLYIFKQFSAFVVAWGQTIMR